MLVRVVDGEVRDWLPVKDNGMIFFSDPSQTISWYVREAADERMPHLLLAAEEDSECQ